MFRRNTLSYTVEFHYKNVSLKGFLNKSGPGSKGSLHFRNK